MARPAGGPLAGWAENGEAGGEVPLPLSGPPSSPWRRCAGAALGPGPSHRLGLGVGLPASESLSAGYVVHVVVHPVPARLRPARPARLSLRPSRTECRLGRPVSRPPRRPPYLAAAGGPVRGGGGPGRPLM